MIKTSKSGLEDVSSISSAGSGKSSRSNASAYSKASNESRRARKVMYRGISVTIQQQQPPVGRIYVELDCPSCDNVTRFQLNSTSRRIQCGSCADVLGRFSITHAHDDLALGPLSFGSNSLSVSISCPNCTRKIYCVTTPEPKGTLLDVFCVCGCYSPKLIVFERQTEREYTCTYCQHIYRSKYAWERHETTKHHIREVWVCCDKDPDGDCVCVFCGQQNPMNDHFDIHRFSRCAKRGVSQRTYARKDQFTQHLRSFHGVSSIPQPLLDHCRRTVMIGEKTWQCGICDASLPSWSARIKHIGQHWDDGYSMENWKEHGQHMELDLQEPSPSGPIRADDSPSTIGQEPSERRSSGLHSFVDNLRLMILSRLPLP
jgi:hypothetical protein